MRESPNKGEYRMADLIFPKVFNVHQQNHSNTKDDRREKRFPRYIKASCITLPLHTSHVNLYNANEKDSKNCKKARTTFVDIVNIFSAFVPALSVAGKTAGGKKKRIRRFLYPRHFLSCCLPFAVICSPFKQVCRQNENQQLHENSHDAF